MRVFLNDETLMMEVEKVLGEKWEEPLVIIHREMDFHQATVNIQAEKTLGVLCEGTGTLS